MASITLDALVTKVKELAERYPDAVYTMEGDFCSYTKGTAGEGVGCIFGQALIALDPGCRDRLVGLEEGTDGIGIERILVMLGVVPDTNNPLIAKLEKVQDAQDDDKPWGKAIKELTGANE